jgi:hypothetical protein
MHGHMNVKFVAMHGHMNIKFVAMHGHMNVKSLNFICKVSSAFLLQEPTTGSCREPD